MSHVGELVKIDGNNVCADCGDKDPKWVSINIGVFLCIQCAGVHRHLGTHISQMRSVLMDVFSPQEQEFLKSMGNKKANAVYEQYLEPSQRINETTDPEARERFVRAKYEAKLFTSPATAKTFVPHASSSKSKATTNTTAMVEYTGILFIRLLNATDLIVADIISSDPYVVFQVGMQKVKSRVIDNSLNPVWNENLQLCINGLNAQLHCTLYDKDINEDDFLGKCFVDLSILNGVKEGQIIEISLPLKNVKKGTINFTISYTSITH